MRPEGLLRLIELVRRELGGTDARAELGGREPNDPTVLWARIPEGFRIVVEFETPPTNREELSERLRRLVAAFSDLGQGNRAEPELLREPLTHRLDSEAEALAARAGAVHAVVIDEKSPVIWGTSTSRRHAADVDEAVTAYKLALGVGRLDRDAAELLALDADERREQLRQTGVPQRELDPLVRQLDQLVDEAQRKDRAQWQEYLLLARALGSVRARTEHPDYVSGHLRETVHGDDDFGYLVRSFAGIYLLILVFDGQFSELHAEGAVVHSLPLVERLVLALPPIEPPPRGAKVVRLRRE